jgi:hypothetical protein
LKLSHRGGVEDWSKKLIEDDFARLPVRKVGKEDKSGKLGERLWVKVEGFGAKAGSLGRCAG